MITYGLIDGLLSVRKCAVSKLPFATGLLFGNGEMLWCLQKKKAF